MPKTRRRNNQKGAKSIAVRIKHKIGGRKSTRGVKQMSTDALEKAFTKCRRKDRAKIWREYSRRQRATIELWFTA